MTRWNGPLSTRRQETGWPKSRRGCGKNKLFAGSPEEMGSVERAYWHFGYLSALQDLRAVLA